MTGHIVSALIARVLEHERALDDDKEDYPPFREFLESPECGAYIAALDVDPADDERTGAVWLLCRSVYDICVSARAGLYDLERIERDVSDHAAWVAAQESRRCHLHVAAQLQGLPEDYYKDLEIERLQRQPRITIGNLSIPRLDKPRMYADPPALNPEAIRGKCLDLMGKGGRQSARSMLIRLIAKYVPDDAPAPYSLIAGFMRIAGVEASRQMVASTLKKGHT